MTSAYSTSKKKMLTTHADHSINSIKVNYPVKIDWTGSKYIGIDLDWNCKIEQVVLSVEGYVKKH